jgi:hypothetical protein
VLLGPGIKPGPPAWQAAAQAAQPSTMTFERKRFQCHEKMFQKNNCTHFWFFLKMLHTLKNCSKKIIVRIFGFSQDAACTVFRVSLGKIAFLF